MGTNPEAVFQAIFIPLAIFGIVTAILVFLHKYKARRLDALVKIVELSGNVDPETVKALSAGDSNYKSDYRRGVIWLAIGFPLTLAMYYDGGIGDAIFGLIPIFIGIALIISGKYRWREE